MTVLDLFALVVMIVLALVAIAAWVLLGMMPGRIARARNHPQAEAINVCGWWGAITLGFLAPLAYIWAYTKPHQDRYSKITNPPDPSRRAGAERSPS